MGSYTSNAAVFLIDTAFMFYLSLVMLRFMLQLTRADFHNPVSQFIVKVTNPPLRLLRRVIPGWKGVDIAAVVLLLALQLAMIWLIHLAIGRSIHVSGLLVLSVSELISLVLNIFLIAILVQVILSWLGPQTYNPISAVLYSLTEPVLRPARRILPPISGIDLSPILAIIGLQLFKILIVTPLSDLGRGLGYN